MNPLTLVKRIQQINSKEASLGISEDASWHTKYKESAYVFVGGIPFDLTEGDLLAVFAQYGEIVDVNLVRDKGTGKSKGFAFIAYEDQRSTNLAVDNLNGAQILGRIVRVDHVTNYKKKEEEDEEAEQKKREERGVCRAFQKGECTRGAGCKFSHDEQRAANTGWGDQDQKGQWGHDRFEGGPRRSESRKPDAPRPQGREMHSNNNSSRGDENGSRQQHGGVDDEYEPRRSRNRSEDYKRKREVDERDSTRRGGCYERRYDGGQKVREDGDRRREEKQSRRRSETDDFEGRPRDDFRDGKEERRPRESRDLRREEKRQEAESYSKEDRKRRGGRWG